MGSIWVGAGRVSSSRERSSMMSANRIRSSGVGASRVSSSRERVNMMSVNDFHLGGCR
jgi:hypothetical protein